MKLYSTPDEDSDAYGPGTDLMLSLFAGILAMVCFLAVIQHQLRKERDDSRKNAAELDKNLTDKDKELADLLKRLKNLEARDLLTIDLTEKGKEDMRPEERKNIAFGSGNYALPPGLQAFIDRKILPDIRRNLLRFTNEVDTLELTGHTDDAGLDSTGRKSIDDGLVAWLATGDRGPYLESSSDLKAPPPLKSGSNVELGFLRAVNVALYLKSRLKDEFPKLKFRCTSAGPTVMPDDSKTYHRSDPLRRRIEIRFTKGRGKGMLDDR